MQKKLLIVLLISFGFISSAYGQLAVRQIPFFMKADFNKYYPNPKLFPSTYRYVPTPMPPEAYKFKAPEKIQNPDAGFDLINVSNLAGSQSETWMAINPNNPNMLIATSNDFANNHSGVGYRMSSFVSTDAGKTWKHSTTPSNMAAGYIAVPQGMGATNFDPGISFDGDGKVYYAYGFCQVPGDNTEGDNGVFVTSSTDGGFTWGDIEAVQLEIDGTTTQPFNDRYTIVADNIPASPHKNNVYIAWQRFRVNPAVVISRFDPDKGYWESPKEIGTGATQAPMPVVGPNGEVYVTWHSATANDNIDAIVVKSTDGGVSFTSGKIAQTVKPIGTKNQDSKRQVLADKQNIRVSSVAQIAVDCSNGPRRGWVYVVQAGKEKDGSGKNGIFLARSTDGGSNWLPSLRIDNNELRNDLFFSSITVDPVTGMVAVFYYSSQNDPANVGVDGYIAISTDGATFQNIRLTPKTIYLNHPNTVSQQGTGNYYWGDYSSIVAYNGMIYPLFWWPTAANYYEHSLELFTVRLGNAPKPPTAATAQNLPVSPVEVKLTWIDPTEDLLGTPLTSFKIYIYRNNVKLGEVDKGVLEYTDKTVVDGTTYTYQLAAVNDAGAQSTFAEVTISAGGALKPNPPTDLTPRPAANGILLSWMNPSQRIDGTEFNDFEKLNIYVDGALTQTLGKTQVQAGNYSQSLIELETGKFYKIKLKAVGKRGEIETESDFSSEMVAYAGAPLTEVSENFDGASKIPFYTNKEWGYTTEKSVSAPNSFTDAPDAKYENRTETHAIIAPFYVGETNKTLSFEHIALIEKNDIGYVYVSTDFGKNWLVLKSYNVESSDKFVLNNIASSDWEEAHIGLGNFTGDTVFIKFSISANAFTNSDGWFIDDLNLDDNPNSVHDFDLANSFRLESYPNPVSYIANVRLTLPLNGDLDVALYDAMGNSILSLADKYYQTGIYNFNFNTTNLANGAYYLRATAGGITKTIAIIVEK